MATGGKGPLVRPHQLLDACARSAVVRERNRDLVQLSVGAVAGLVKSDQDDGIALDPAQLASAIEHMLAKGANAHDHKR